jgi:hypothetical protein
VSLYAQVPLTWKTLNQVAFVTERDPLGGYPMTKPVFAPGIQALADQVIEISGYVLPIDTEGQHYVLSAFPYSSCFFCGGAGRESVIELVLTPGHRRFEQDEYLRFRGQLSLQEEEYDLIYRLEAAQLVE